MAIHIAHRRKRKRDGVISLFAKCCKEEILSMILDSKWGVRKTLGVYFKRIFFTLSFMFLGIFVTLAIYYKPWETPTEPPPDPPANGSSSAAKNLFNATCPQDQSFLNSLLRGDDQILNLTPDIFLHSIKAKVEKDKNSAFPIVAVTGGFLESKRTGLSMELVPFYIRPAVSPSLCGHKVILFQGVVTNDVPLHDVGVTPFPLTLSSGATGTVGIMTSAKGSISHVHYTPTDPAYPYIVTNVTIIGQGVLASYAAPQDGPISSWWGYSTSPNVIFSNRVSGSTDIALRLYNSGEIDLDVPSVATEISNVFRYASCVKMVPWYFQDIFLKGLVDASVGSAGAYDMGLVVKGTAEVKGYVEANYVLEPTLAIDEKVDRHYVTCGDRLWQGVGECMSIGEFSSNEELRLDVELAPVRCCTEFESQSMIDLGWKKNEGCSVYGGSDEGWECQILNWEDAGNFCESVGGRLCTKEEVDAGCTEGTGCDYDETLVWTSTDALSRDAPGTTVKFELRAGKASELNGISQTKVCVDPVLTITEVLEEDENIVTGYKNDTAKIVEAKTEFLTKIANNATTVNQYKTLHLPLKGAPTFIDFNFQGEGRLTTTVAQTSLWSMWQQDALKYTSDQSSAGSISLASELIPNRYIVATLKAGYRTYIGEAGQGRAGSACGRNKPNESNSLISSQIEDTRSSKSQASWTEWM